MSKRTSPQADAAEDPPSKRPRRVIEVAACKTKQTVSARYECPGGGEDDHRPELSQDDAVTTLLEQSDEWIRCIEALREQAKSPSSAGNWDKTGIRERLASISRRLLPAVQALACPTQERATVEGKPAMTAVPSHVSYTKWTSADIPDTLPPLPEIKDAAVERAAFTHPSVAGVATPVRENCDRLEWLGDAYLELFATCFIYETFTDMAHGRCTQIREMLIRNESLSEWALGYGLDKRARVSPGIGVVAAGKKTKFLGDIFEAYVGAVIISDPLHGVARAASWLKGVWAMKIGHKIVDEERRLQSLGLARAKESEDCSFNAEPAPKLLTSKEQLARLLVVPGVKLRYVDFPLNRKDRDNNLQLFCVGVIMDGWGEKEMLLGRGVALGKKEAGNKAAQMAIDNKKLLKKFVNMKQAFLEASRESRGRHEDAPAGPP